jgi:hypothetical protein
MFATSTLRAHSLGICAWETAPKISRQDELGGVPAHAGGVYNDFLERFLRDDR